MVGQTKHIGKLGSLLGDYEEEREAERVRTMRRERAREMERESDLIPEEDDDSDEELEDTTGAGEEEWGVKVERPTSRRSNLSPSLEKLYLRPRIWTRRPWFIEI